MTGTATSCSTGPSSCGAPVGLHGPPPGGRSAARRRDTVPSTRLIDLNLKRAAYERGGVASYWVVDPDEVRLLVHQLRAGTYVEVADVSGEETRTASAPFPVTVAPAWLTD